MNRQGICPNRPPGALSRPVAMTGQIDWPPRVHLLCAPPRVHRSVPTSRPNGRRIPRRWCAPPRVHRSVPTASSRIRPSTMLNPRSRSRPDLRLRGDGPRIRPSAMANPRRARRSTIGTCDDRAAGTTMAALVAVALCLVTVVLLLVSGYVLAAHRARAAADLAALAGATAYVAGQDACATAGRSAQTNRGQLTRCRVEGTTGSFVVTVTAQVSVGWAIPGTPRTVSAEARAGNA